MPTDKMPMNKMPNDLLAFCPDFFLLFGILSVSTSIGILSGQNANKSFGICPLPFCPHTMIVMSGSKGCVLMTIVALEIHFFFTESEVLNLPT